MNPVGLIGEIIFIEFGLNCPRRIHYALLAMPCKWNVNIIISLFKGKGEALDRLNYRDLNLTERILKLIEKIIEGFIHNIRPSHTYRLIMCGIHY